MDIIPDDDGNRRPSKLAEQLKSKIIRLWRSAGRYDFTDAELEAEVQKRLAAIQASPQLFLPLCDAPQLPLIDVGQVSSETKRESFEKTRKLRVNRLVEVEKELELAGPSGRTREQLSHAIGCKEGSVCQPVCKLIRSGKACEPFRTVSNAGQLVAVVVLTKYAASRQAAA